MCNKALARKYLEEISQKYSGSSVELRVPGAGAVQILQTGTKHRRGTPNTVVEMDIDTWIRLYEKDISFRELYDSEALFASGPHIEDVCRIL